MTDWHLAQINVARLVAPAGDPRVRGFFELLERVNAIADASPGFIWRLQTESGNAMDIQPTGDPRLVVNMSVWQDAESLFDFVYRSGHIAVMARRREWFERPSRPHVALWWVPAGHRPSVEEAVARLDHLERHGPTPQAFTSKRRFPAPSGHGAGSVEQDRGAARCG